MNNSKLALTLDETFIEVIQEAVKKAVEEQWKAQKDAEELRKLHSIPEVMEITGRSRKYIERRIESGALQTSRDGKYISGKALQHFLNNTDGTDGK